VFDGPPHFSSAYRVRFIDDVNLKNADAFDSEVESIYLCVFNADNDTLVATYSATADSLKRDDVDHCIEITGLEPGAYHLVAWGGVHDDSSYSVTSVEPKASRLSDLTCRLTRKTRAKSSEDYDVVDTNINNLFHGTTDIYIPDPLTNDPEWVTFDIHLTKNTHRVSVTLQQLDGETMDPDDYDFTIEADNGHLDHDNNIIHDERSFIYRAYDKKSINIGAADDDAVVNGLTAVTARHTISRLMTQAACRDDGATYTQPKLVIYNTRTDEKLVSIPLIDFMLAVRDNYPQTTDDQDYLDRQDDCNFTFFINNGKWLDAYFLVNSWKVILNHDDL
jgi:hypothetical protein